MNNGDFSMYDWTDNAIELGANTDQVESLPAIPLLLKAGCSLDVACNERLRAQFGLCECLHDVLTAYLYKTRNRKAPNFSRYSGDRLLNDHTKMLFIRLDKMNYWDSIYEVDGWYLCNRWDFITR